MKYDYLLLKRNGNKDGLVYDKLFFDNAKEAKKQFKKNDILLKCKLDSVFSDGFNWAVKQEDVIKEYEK